MPTPETVRKAARVIDALHDANIPVEGVTFDEETDTYVVETQAGGVGPQGIGGGTVKGIGGGTTKGGE